MTKNRALLHDKAALVWFDTGAKHKLKLSASSFCADAHSQQHNTGTHTERGQYDLSIRKKQIIVKLPTLLFSITNLTQSTKRKKRRKSRRLDGRSKTWFKIYLIEKYIQVIFAINDSNFFMYKTTVHL